MLSVKLSNKLATTFPPERRLDFNWFSAITLLATGFSETSGVAFWISASKYKITVFEPLTKKLLLNSSSAKVASTSRAVAEIVELLVGSTELFTNLAFVTTKIIWERTFSLKVSLERV